MIETRDKVINKVNYSVTQFPARTGLRIKTKLLKLLAPSVLSLVGSSENVLDTKLDSAVLGKAVQALSERLDEDVVLNLISELLLSTKRDGKDITEGVFNLAYAGNYGELFKALLFVLEVNYGAFFREMGIGKLGASESSN